jgi:3-oxoacyl-[acyl-carrier protein] reductase
MTTAVVGATAALGAALATGLGTEAREFDAPLPKKLRGVVLVVGADPPPIPTPLHTMTDAGWQVTAEEVLRRSMIMLQRSREALLHHGGHIVVITPTIAMTGASTLVAYTTACEGVRALAKSAARQWAREDIRVNLLAVPVQLIAPGIAGLATHLTPAALGDPQPLLAAVVRSVEFLLEPSPDALTGATLVADGGSVMLP